jgi:hypothetical protein
LRTHHDGRSRTINEKNDRADALKHAQLRCLDRQPRPAEMPIEEMVAGTESVAIGWYSNDLCVSGLADPPAHKLFSRGFAVERSIRTILLRKATT